MELAGQLWNPAAVLAILIGTAIVQVAVMRPHSILVLNPKGGCGKTTIATNLASYYARAGRSTALFDFDRQRSSLQWLDQRPGSAPSIHGMSGWDQRRFPDGTHVVVMDSPAQVDRQDLRSLLSRADTVLIPVLPSPIDIRAVADFIAVLLIYGKVRETHKNVAVVANRVRLNTRVYDRLMRFLRSLDIPFVATLRDTQNYIRAADQGLGIFDLHPPSLIERDIEQWRPLLELIELAHARLAVPMPEPPRTAVR
jgi:chromosome partitioning protein